MFSLYITVFIKMCLIIIVYLKNDKKTYIVRKKSSNSFHVGEECVTNYSSTWL